MLLQAIREELVTLNQALPENGLVTWTSGNVNIRDPETGNDLPSCCLLAYRERILYNPISVASLVLHQAVQADVTRHR